MQLVRFSMLLCAFFALSLSFQSCGDDGNTGSIPFVNVNVQLDLNDPSFIALNPFGGYILLDGYGNRGLVIYHNFDDTYSCYDRICSHQPSNPCSIVEVEESGLYLQCGVTNGSEYTPCCDSKFLWDGFPTDGPAIYPLQAYQVYKNGNLITISNL